MGHVIAMDKTLAAEMTSKKKLIPERTLPDTETVLKEVQRELQMIKSLNEGIEELETKVASLERYIIDSDTGCDQRANKWRERYLAQVRTNENLEKQRNFLREELETERMKITNGWSKFPYVYGLDGDISEAELQRLVRQLEMVKHNLSSELRDTEWKLDQESTAYHQLNEMCRIYKLELNAVRTNSVCHPCVPSDQTQRHSNMKKSSTPAKENASAKSVDLTIRDLMD